MKLQLESPVIRTVRESEQHLLPKNPILMILIFLGVNYGYMMAVLAGVMPFMLGEIITIGKEIAASDTAPDSMEISLRLAAYASAPDMMIPSLFATGLGTIVVLLWCRLVEGRKLRTMGFVKERAVTQYLIGLLGGFLTFSLIVGVSALLGGVEYSGFKGQFTLPLLLCLIGFGIQGMSEEVLSRGYMMTSTLRYYNVWWAVGINAVIFAFNHHGNTGFSLMAVLNLFLYAVMISFYMLRTGNIWGACAFHSIWNFVQGHFFGLPVSGMTGGDVIFAFSLKGPDLFSGGDFGLEASLGATIVLGIWIVCLLLVPDPFAKKHSAPETGGQDT